jgi:hypothetical protein
MRAYIFVTLFTLFITNAASASEAAYAPVRKFIPLRQPSINQHSRQPLIIPEAKFFPLNQARYPAPLTQSAKNETLPVKSQEPAQTLQQSGTKPDMTPKQAQQILSLFTQNQNEASNN